MVLKKYSSSVIASLLLSATGVVHAASNAIPISSNIGYGFASNNHSIFSTSANPAWISGNLHEENNYGFGIAAGVRFKQNLNNFYQDYQNNIEPLLTNFNPTGLNALAEAQAIEQAVNTIILNARNSYLQLDANFALPVVVANNKFGGFGVELSALTSSRLKVLSSGMPIMVNQAYLLANQNATRNEMIEHGLISDAALYVRRVTLKEIAVKYGNQFFETEDGRLSVGIRVKYMQAELVRFADNFKQYLKTSNIDKNRSNEATNHTDIGIDLGVQWFAENYMLGLTVMNINSPSFEFNELTFNPPTLTEPKTFTNQILTNETLTLVPQARIEGAVYSDNRRWTLAGSYDLNEANDLVNQKYQWATASVSYASDASNRSWWAYLVRDTRIGYQANLAGDKDSYITVGASWGFVNLDLGFTEFADLGRLAKADVNDLPKGLMASLGLEFYF